MRERLLNEEYLNWKYNPSLKYDSTLSSDARIAYEESIKEVGNQKNQGENPVERKCSTIAVTFKLSFSH